MLMVQTSEYIEDSHHQYELASLEAECGCACIYFICKVVYCNKQPFLETSMTITNYGVFIKQLSVCDVPIKLCFANQTGARRALRCAAHCGTPRIAAHRTYMVSCRKKMTGSFQILE